MNADITHASARTPGLGGWIFGSVLIVIGILNIVLVHAVPGIAYLLLSLVYLPPASAALRRRTGLAVPLIAKVILGIVVIWFTLGISDLAEILGL